MRFSILRSINNIYTAKGEDGKIYTLRIKGKTLKNSDVYNPVVVGDYVIGSLYSETEGLIEKVEERKSYFSRWNFKTEQNQIIASNQDINAIVFSPLSPPFRPRFVDRAIACSHSCDILLILNKADYGLTEEEKDRWEEYKRLGYDAIAVSSITGQGLDKLKEKLKGKITSFIGQSGVGKSTLINSLLGSGQRTGEVSNKYNRGRHTTNYSLFLEGEDFSIIDTPGVREIQVPLLDMIDVRNTFPELRNCDCLYSSCLHRGEEGCIVPEKVEEGLIHYDRYESYLRILDSFSLLRPSYMRNKK